MPALSPSSDAVSQIGRTAHDLGLAGLLGGNLFGRMALHPAVAGISDKGERGKVVNAAWRRYGTVNSLSLAAVVGGWTVARFGEAADARLAPGERGLARAKDALVAAVAVTGLATAAQGVRFAREAPEGAVPLEDGSTPAPEATDSAARGKRVLDALGAANILTDVALVTVNAALTQRQHRRPALRRWALLPR
jgi:hypothetical protein